jgi:opacity protein-like surface antigen
MSTSVTGACYGFFLLAACAMTQAQPNGPATAAPQASGPGALQITPKNGQNEQQLWSDRYACHDWAKQQSGFDPTRPVAGQDASAGLEQYRRAMTACLEARGYGVSFGAPAAAAAATSAAGATVGHAVPVHAGRTLHYHPWQVQIGAGYTLTEGSLKPSLYDGPTVNLGLHWFPSTTTPLGVRIDLSYSSFGATLAARDAAAVTTGTNVTDGYQNVYGGDADLQLDLLRGSRMKLYVYGGLGWYRQQNAFQATQWVPAYVCGFYWCGPGYVSNEYTVERNTTAWLKSWNAGVGFEFALSDPTTFFIEARYLRVEPYDQKQEYIPIMLGLRF